MSSQSPIRIVFMGSDAIALPTLDCLLSAGERLKIEAVYTQPDRARGRGKKVQANEIKIWAIQNECAVNQPEVFGEAEIAELRSLGPDIILVMAYGHILPQAVLDVPRLGIYNIHTSLLPELRGASPIETAVATGKNSSGVSLMKLVMKMDAGPICDQEPVEIDRRETGGSYREKLAQASPVVLRRNLAAMLDGSIGTKEQDERAVTYCRILVKQDAQLNFNESAEVLAKRINGLNPWPGAVAELGETKLKVGLADWSEDRPDLEPGIVIGAKASGLDVSTAQGTLHLLALQKPGGKMLPVDAFLLGHPIPPGARFESREMHGLVSRKPVSHKRVFQLYRKP